MQKFQVDTKARQKKQVEIYQLMVDLIKAEDACQDRVRESEQEVTYPDSVVSNKPKLGKKKDSMLSKFLSLHYAQVQKILNERTREEATSEIEISVYDTMRNEKAKRHRKELVSLKKLIHTRESKCTQCFE